jgi:hypothetical protein
LEEELEWPDIAAPKHHHDHPFSPSLNYSCATARKKKPCCNRVSTPSRRQKTRRRRYYEMMTTTMQAV